MTRQITASFTLSTLAALMLAACSPAEQKAAEPAAAPASGAQTQAAAPAGEAKKIAITAIVEHPALDAVRKGVLDELKAKGYEEGKNLTVDFQSAQGSTANAAQIAKKFVGDNPDVIVAIAADKDVAYDAVAQALSVAKEAGITKVGFVTETRSQ